MKSIGVASEKKAVWGVGLALVSALATGCAAEVNGATATSETDTSGTSRQIGEESLTATVTSVTGTVTTAVTSTVPTTVSTTGQLVGICAPLTCCFPAGAEWGSNDFENGLRALGCTTPQAYTERYGSTNWWMYTKCTQSTALSALIKKYANVAPYNPTIAVNECLLLSNLTTLKLTDVFVAFDPTCTSCRPVTMAR